jgi:heme exporter protein D
MEKNVLGEHLSANVAQADLLDIASKYPALIWSAIIILVVVVAWYLISKIAKKKTNLNQPKQMSQRSQSPEKSEEPQQPVNPQ